MLNLDILVPRLKIVAEVSDEELYMSLQDMHAAQQQLDPIMTAMTSLRDLFSLVDSHGTNEVINDMISDVDALNIFNKPFMECSVDEALEGIMSAIGEGIAKAWKAFVDFLKRVVKFIINLFKRKPAKVVKGEVKKQKEDSRPTWQNIASTLETTLPSWLSISSYATRHYNYFVNDLLDVVARCTDNAKLVAEGNWNQIDLRDVHIAQPHFIKNTDITLTKHYAMMSFDITLQYDGNSLSSSKAASYFKIRDDTMLRPLLSLGYDGIDVIESSIDDLTRARRKTEELVAKLQKLSDIIAKGRNITGPAEYVDNANAVLSIGQQLSKGILEMATVQTNMYLRYVTECKRIIEIMNQQTGSNHKILF